MKKSIITGLILIIIGFLLGNIIFKTKTEVLTSLKKDETMYFIQEGIYPTEDSLKKNTNYITPKIIEKKNHNYYVYLGITNKKKIANKLKNIYNKKGYQVAIKEKNIINEEFKINLTQFDLLIEESNDIEEILTIEEVVLSNYEELLKKQ